MKSLVWFITGASRGFGLEIARAALERGDAVVAAARDPRVVQSWRSPQTTSRGHNDVADAGLI